MATGDRAPGRASFLSRVGPAPGGGRTLADHVHPAPGAAAGPARFLARVGTAPAAARGRTLADHLHPPAQASPGPTAQVGRARESERRTVLDAADPVLTLAAADLPRRGRLTATLSWAGQRTAGGVTSSTDVHLACLWQTADGEHSGVVQSVDELRSAPGFGARQVMRLGPRSEVEGEALTIDLATLDTMRRLLLLAHTQHGPGRWGPLQARLTLVLPSGAQVVLRPGEPVVPARSIVLASVHLVGTDLVLRREDEAFEGPVRDAAVAYGWDLDWTPEGTTLRR